MGTYTAPATGGTVRASNLADIVVGSAASDTLYGFGGADVMDGGAGNDVIHGDGIYTVNDAILGDGHAVLPYTGTASSVSGLQLLFMGTLDGKSVWSIQNASDAPLTVVLESASQGPSGSISITVAVPAHSEYLVTSSLVGTHKLYLNGKLVDTEGAGKLTFDNTSAYGVSLDGDDTVNGGDGNDTIYGNGGNDTLNGDAGDDTIDGGDGADTLTGGEDDDTLTGGAGADVLTAGTGNDTLSGGTDNDTLYGGAGTDTLNGDAGNDRLTGNEGADSINGGDGVDTADYRKSSVGVTVSLLTNTGTGGDAEGDTLTSIENLSGSAFDDTLIGNDGANRLTGMSGQDKIYGMGGNDYIATGGGYDYVDGGDGIDTVTYEDSWDHVVVNLTTGKNQYGEASRDVLVNVENIVGSIYDDSITGDAAANRLTGGAGNDTLNGMAGIDYLYGGLGNDTMTGGTEADVFVFETGGFGDDTITDFWTGDGRTDRIWLKGLGVTSMDDPDWSITDSAAGAVITIEGQGSITLAGVTASQLQADDFIFG